MPLRSGSSPGAFKANVRTLMGEIGKSPHVQSRAQALAIAYAKQREGRADGGLVGGLVDHERDPELPSVKDDVSLEPMMAHQQDPAYVGVIQRLIEGQRRLNALAPAQREQVRRFMLGGVVRALQRGGLV
ncbi:MAG: hypothetical protein C5B60_03450 [Chloroflexi bacterium]|nr:MAG: hypothetical protein C5B60_03450 [Chloroflexota bacterium]